MRNSQSVNSVDEELRGCIQSFILSDLSFYMILKNLSAFKEVVMIYCKILSNSTKNHEIYNSVFLTKGIH